MENNEQMEQEYKMPWGTITLHDDGSYLIVPNFSIRVWDYFEGATVFAKDGAFGCMKEGEVICPPVFDKIEFIKDGETVFLQRGGMYTTFSRSGSNVMNGSLEKKDGFFVADGKKGWLRDGKVLIPAVHDEIYKWWGLDVFQVEDGDAVRFFNSAGEEVLTYVRELDAEDIYISPFSQVMNDGDIFTVLEYPANKAIPVSNVILTDGGEKVSINRFSRSELMEELVNPADLLPLRKEDLALFNNDFSYEYSAYRFTVGGEHPVDRLLELFGQFGVPSNSWNYVIRICTAPGSPVPAMELRALRYYMEAESTRCLSKLVAVGEDKALSPGEMSVLVITHYNERCWPAHFEFQWIDDCNSCTLEQLLEKEVEMKKAVEENVLEQYKAEVLEDQYKSAFYNVRYNRKRTWEEAEKVYDYLGQKSRMFTSELRSYCLSLNSARCISEMKYFLHLVEWALRNGAVVNLVEGGRTALDAVEDGLKHERIDGRKRVLRKTKDLLLSYGAKTLSQLRSDEKAGEPSLEYELEMISDGRKDIVNWNGWKKI